MKSFKNLYMLFLNSQISKAKLLLIFVLGLASILISYVTKNAESDDLAISASAFFVSFCLPLYIPISSVVFATGAFSDFKEDESLVYLTLSPLDRIYLVLANWLASMTLVLATVIPIIILTMYNISSDTNLALKALFASVMATMTYTAVFGLLSLLLRRAIFLGLIYVLLWEITIASIFDANTGTIAKLSIQHYARSIFWNDSVISKSLDFQDVFATTRTSASIVVLVIMTVVALFFSRVRLNAMRIS